MFDKFTTIDHMLNHETSFNNLEKLKLPIFYQNGIKLGTPNKMIFRKTILRLKKYRWVREEITKESRKYF